MAIICSRLQVLPRWALAFGVGMLIGWVSFSINDTLFRDSHSDREIATVSSFNGHDVHVHAAPDSEHSTNSVSNNRIQLPPKYHPVNKFDMQSWQYFDHSAIFEDESISMVHWRRANQHMNLEIENALKDATQLVGQQLAKTVHMSKLISGYVRHNPTRGYEYIIDAQYMEDCEYCVKKAIARRVSFVRIPAAPVAVDDIAVSNQVVNVVVPISNVNQRLEEFLENFEHAFLKGGDAVRLVFVVYQEDMQSVESTVEHYRSKYKSAQITVIQGKETFSRGRALHHGMASLQNNDLAFICDIDITIEHSFLDRCRRNTIQSQRVFYPVVFKQYNTKYTQSKGVKPGKESINRKNGHWFYYSYGMLCIYKSDYTAVGGLDIEIEGWGLEDVLLFEAVLKAKLEVLKAPDPALTHRWHESHCPSTLTPKQHSDCLGSLYEGMADKKELAQYIYDHGYQIKD